MCKAPTGLNQTFAPISSEDVHLKKALATLSYEVITGRKGDDVRSAYIIAFNLHVFTGILRLQFGYMISGKI